MPATRPTLGFVLHDVARLLRKRFEQRTRAVGLTRSQWQVLAYLSINPGIQQGALADILEVEPITLGRILDRLGAAGLVVRERHPTDRRSWLLRLTEAAEPLLGQMSALGELTRGEALLGIGAADQERLLANLTLMRTNLIAACARPVAGPVPQTFSEPSPQPAGTPAEDVTHG